ncbi:hypothetical protein Dxin01_03400 [Deinococcus xinjiangensis]|uniref:Peptidase M41 domain-containing protein n=1 Tax=Deinococcus xinjiangensis TaxID=457454 RepID=A0ABP9VEH5_9DEIO
MALPELWNEDDSWNYRAQAAIHEAGHTVMLCRWQRVLGVDVGNVYIREDKPDSLGEMRYVGGCRRTGYVEPPEVTRQNFTHEPILFRGRRIAARTHKAEALVIYAGVAAESIAGVDDAEYAYLMADDWGPRNDIYRLERTVSILCFLVGDESESGVNSVLRR